MMLRRGRYEFVRRNLPLGHDPSHTTSQQVPPELDDELDGGADVGAGDDDSLLDMHG